MYGAQTETMPVMPLRQENRWLKGLQGHPNAWIIGVDGALAVRPGWIILTPQIAGRGWPSGYTAKATLGAGLVARQ
jgi:hypothetical protein